MRMRNAFCVDGKAILKTQSINLSKLVNIYLEFVTWDNVYSLNAEFAELSVSIWRRLLCAFRQYVCAGHCGSNDAS